MAATGNNECFGVYLDTSGSEPICMLLKNCPSKKVLSDGSVWTYQSGPISDSTTEKPIFYLAPLMKSSLHNPSSQQSLWVKLPGSDGNKLQLPFGDEYNFHPMSSYALSCKYHKPFSIKSCTLRCDNIIF